jgi:hypothetical protein
MCIYIQSVQSITAFNYKENNNQEKQYQRGIYQKLAVLLINCFARFGICDGVQVRGKLGGVPKKVRHRRRMRDRRSLGFGEQLTASFKPQIGDVVFPLAVWR